MYAIARNEAGRVEAWAASAAEADVTVLADTGSDDDTAERAAALAVDVHHVQVEPFRYDVARNRALDLLPADVDLCVPLDMDEELEPGWREQLDEAWAHGASRVLYSLVWRWSDVHPALRYTSDKIHARHGYRWRFPVHEQVVAEGPDVSFRSDIVVRHVRTGEKPRPDYLALLHVAVEEHPDDGRLAHMLADEARRRGLWDEARTHAHRALELDAPPNERLHAMLMLSWLEPGWRAAWVLEACGQFPRRREPWCELAQLHLALMDARAALGAARRALSIDEKPDDYLVNVFAYSHWPEELASMAASQLGQLDVAAHHARRAHLHVPDDPVQLDRLQRCVSALRGRPRPSPEPVTSPLPVYVVVPVKDRVEMTRRLITELVRQGGFQELYIFDNGSTPLGARSLDAAVSQLEGRARVTIVAAAGMNLHAMWNDGMRMATDAAGGPCDVAILNNDLAVGPTFLRGLSAALRSDDRLWAVSPNYDHRLGSGVELTTSTAKNGGLAGFAFMVRGECFDDGRLAFDEAYQWLFGDDDLVAQVEAAGAKVGIALDVDVEHLGGGSQSVRDMGLSRLAIAADQQRMADRWGHT
ncbi:MAG: epsH 1 [Acidimicrobiales bacterium]|nr:epsH 1 [Acidimicrobiales bacterium]